MLRQVATMDEVSWLAFCAFEYLYNSQSRVQQVLEAFS